MRRIPFGLRVVGGVLAFLGVLNIGAIFLVPERAQMDVTGADLALNVGTSGVLIATGLGLVTGARWSWWAATGLALAMIGLGYFVLAQPGDITVLGAPFVALFFLILPGLLLLAGLLLPSTRRWRRGELQETRSA